MRGERPTRGGTRQENKYAPLHLALLKSGRRRILAHLGGLRADPLPLVAASERAMSATRTIGAPPRSMTAVGPTPALRSGLGERPFTALGPRFGLPTEGPLTEPIPD